MSADGSAAPAGHLDEGETIYYVRDRDGILLSAHRTKQGAEAGLEFTAGATGINETTGSTSRRLPWRAGCTLAVSRRRLLHQRSEYLERPFIESLLSIEGLSQDAGCGGTPA